MAGISLLFLVAAQTACAHYNYPYACCGDYDCGPVISIIPTPNGDKRVTIMLQNGVERAAIFPKDQQSQPPVDDRDHACIGNNLKPLCLFLNGGV